MSLLFYKVLHLVGLILVFFSLGGMVTLQLSGASDEAKAKSKKSLAISHGVGLLILLVAGFGLLAKLKLSLAQEGWVIVKLVLWFFVGGSIALIRRKPAAAKLFFLLMPLIGFIAAYLAIYKPF